MRAEQCPTSGRVVPACRLFEQVLAYHEDPNTVSGARVATGPARVITKFDGFHTTVRLAPPRAAARKTPSWPRSWANFSLL